MARDLSDAVMEFIHELNVARHNPQVYEAPVGFPARDHAVGAGYVLHSQRSLADRFAGVNPGFSNHMISVV